jgi:hypothetical protein
MTLHDGKLSNGQRFPDLEATTVDGATLRLPEDLDPEWTAVLFYRGHW